MKADETNWRRRYEKNDKALGVPGAGVGNGFSFGAGETANLTFTPQYTAEYTLKLYGHVTGGRNIRASLTDPDGTVTNFEYPNRTGSTVKDYSHPYLTATLEQGKTYTNSVWGWTANSTGATVDVDCGCIWTKRNLPLTASRRC